MFNLFSTFYPKASAAADSEPLLPDLDYLPLKAITGERHIASVLRGLAEAQRTVQLSSFHLKTLACTRLLGVDVSAGEAFIRHLGSEEEHADLVRDGHINLMSRHGDTPLMGSLDLLGNGVYKGTSCYVAALPAYLLLSDMRSNLRVHVAKSRQIQLTYAHPAQERLVARVTNVSEDGLGLVLPHQPLCGVALHDLWLKSRLNGSEGEIGVLDLELCRVIPMASGELYFGAAIVDTTESTRQRLRRLILRLQSGSTNWGST